MSQSLEKHAPKYIVRDVKVEQISTRIKFKKTQEVIPFERHEEKCSLCKEDMNFWLGKKASQVISPEFDFQMEYFQTLEMVIPNSTSVR